MTIRPIEAADEVEWRRLWTLYLAFYETAVDEAVYAQTFARLLSDDARAPRGMVAERAGGGLCGLVHTIVHPHCWRIEPVTYLQDLYVDEDRRGTGLGRALIEAAYAAADRAGAPAVYWLTQEHNAVARRLYDRIARNTGFIRYQRR